MAWKCPGIELMSSTDEEEDSTDVGEELADLLSIFQALGSAFGVPIMLSEFAVKLLKAAVEKRLNGCLPISLWMKIFTPLLKFMPSKLDS